MTDLALNASDNTSAKFDTESQAFKEQAEMGELSMEELDEASGGLVPLLMAVGFFAGYGIGAFYRDHRGR
jgi:hypothetical protein